MKNKFHLILFFVLNIIILDTYSQSDTAVILKKLINKHTIFENLNINFTTRLYTDTSIIVRKKIWLSYSKKDLNLRAELYDIKTNKLKSITIINKKQMYYINPESKRSDLYQFNLMNDKDLNIFYNERLLEFLPSYFINEGNSEQIIKDLIDEIRKKENIKFEIINNKLIDNELCFGFKIIDYDKNNGFIVDKSGNSNDKYAVESEENIYFKVSDSTLVERSFTYYYENPSLKRKSLEKIESFLLNDNSNKNIHLYNINNDTLKNYFKTISKFNGFETETELADFSINIAPDIYGLSIDNKEYKLTENKFKYQLLGFWNYDCEECLIQLNAINEELTSKMYNNFNFTAINISDEIDKELLVFFKNKNYKFPVVFSNTAGEQYLTNKPPYYILLDEKQKIKEIFYDLNEDKLNSILIKVK